jgi:hypothetical protein
MTYLMTYLYNDELYVNHTRLADIGGLVDVFLTSPKEFQLISITPAEETYPSKSIEKPEPWRPFKKKSLGEWGRESGKTRGGRDAAGPSHSPQEIPKEQIVARARKIETHKRVVTKVPQTLIQLDLTPGDADMLIAVLAKVGGSPHNSPRKYATRVMSALMEVTGGDWESTDSFPLMEGSLFFGNYPDPSRSHES